MRKQYDKKTPDNTFDRVANDLDDSGLTEDPFIPDVWGTCKGVPGICLNKDIEVPPSGADYYFMLCGNTNKIADDSVKAMYINGTLLDITIPDVELIDNAYFIKIPTKYFSVLDGETSADLSYEGMDDFTVDMEGYTSDTGTLYKRGLNIIRKILNDAYDITFSSVYYQSVIKFAIQDFQSYDIGYYVDKPTEVYKQLEEIQKSLLGSLKIDADLKLYWTTDDEPDTLFEIEQQDILGADWIPSIEQNPTTALGTFRVGHSKRWAAKEYDYRVDDSNIDNALQQYNSREQKDFDTLLYKSADIDDFIDRVKPFTAMSTDTVSIEIPLTDESSVLAGGDWVRVPIDLPTKRILGYTKCQILSTNINIESMTIALELRIMELSSYLIDSNDFYLVDSENNRLYAWS